MIALFSESCDIFFQKKSVFSFFSQIFFVYLQQRNTHSMNIVEIMAAVVIAAVLLLICLVIEFRHAINFPKDERYGDDCYESEDD